MSAIKFREMVDVIYADKIINLTNGIAAVDAQIAELNEQKDAIEWGMIEAKNDQDARLTTKGDSVYTFGNYGVLNLSDFEVYDLLTVTGLTYFSDDSFDVDGDQTLIFTTGLKLICDCGTDGLIYRTVLSSSFLDPETRVSLSVGTAITVNLASVYELVYEYLGIGWDSDTEIIANIDYFPDSYDHLNDTISISGTHGINDKISKLNTAKSILQADLVKYEDLVVLYDRFAT